LFSTRRSKVVSSLFILKIKEVKENMGAKKDQIETQVQPNSMLMQIKRNSLLERKVYQITNPIGVEYLD
jgi:hypothetical protein